jgi:alkylation response protein AidB-like acyl-CoA dehydrogenase
MFSEPSAGSDVAGLSSRAVRDGDEWVVDGQKVWTSGAHLARYALLLARTEPDAEKHAGLTAFVIDLADPGVEVRPLRQMNGGTEFSEVFINGVRIPDAERRWCRSATTCRASPRAARGRSRWRSTRGAAATTRRRRWPGP